MVYLNSSKKRPYERIKRLPRLPPQESLHPTPGATAPRSSKGQTTRWLAEKWNGPAGTAGGADPGTNRSSAPNASTSLASPAASTPSTAASPLGGDLNWNPNQSRNSGGGAAMNANRDLDLNISGSGRISGNNNSDNRTSWNNNSGSRTSGNNDSSKTRNSIFGDESDGYYKGPSGQATMMARPPRGPAANTNADLEFPLTAPLAPDPVNHNLARDPIHNTQPRQQSRIGSVLWPEPAAGATQKPPVQRFQDTPEELEMSPL
jgi:hypothetical protein